MKLPHKRLIVFASVKSPQDIKVMKIAQPDALMSTYWELRPTSRHKGLERYDRLVDEIKKIERTRYRYLDSGAFTFINAGWKGKERADLSDFREFADSYVELLKEKHHDWDWIVEMDVHEVYGIEVAHEYRRKLQKIVGDKLLPVWHGVVGHSGWNDLIREFPYVGIGSGAEGQKVKLVQDRIFVREAHAIGTQVHRFGTSSPFFMSKVPYDTCDSTGWISAPRHRRFGRFNLWGSKTMSTTQLAQMREMRREVEALGYDFDWLAEIVKHPIGGETWVKAATIATLLYMKYQDELPKIPKHVLRTPMIVEEPK